LVSIGDGFTLPTHVANVTLSQLTRLSTEGPRRYLSGAKSRRRWRATADKESRC
jgi:hypothetical protein